MKRREIIETSTNEPAENRVKARRLGWISIVETLSFLVLLGAMLADNDQLISIIGAIHGLLFLAYAYLVWVDHEELGWGRWFAIGSIVTGPVGAIVVLEKLRRDGAWASSNYN